MMILRQLFLWVFFAFSMVNPASGQEKSLQNHFSSGPENKLTQANPVAYAGRVLSDDENARILIDFDQKVNLKVRLIDRPSRLVIDLPRTLFSLGNGEQLKPRGRVNDVRYGTLSATHSRMVVTFNGPTIIQTSEASDLDNGHQRWIIDLVPASQVQLTKAIAVQPKPVSLQAKPKFSHNQKPRTNKGEGALPIIMLDPGHGGRDGGALGRKGAVEKNVVLAFAKTLAKTLRDSGRYQVKMTRNNDEYITLAGRVKIAQSAQSDLFISLHADTLKQTEIRGATIYTLSDKASDKLAKNLAISENRSDLWAGIQTEQLPDPVVDILADLLAKETKTFSLRFANLIVDSFRGTIKLIKNPHRFAAFGVLKDLQVPSVLIELGYLSNEQDEQLLVSQVWRQQAAMLLFKAIDQYFATRQ